MVDSDALVSEANIFWSGKQELTEALKKGRTQKRKEFDDSKKPTTLCLFQEPPEAKVCGMEEDVSPKMAARRLGAGRLGRPSTQKEPGLNPLTIQKPVIFLKPGTSKNQITLVNLKKGLKTIVLIKPVSLVKKGQEHDPKEVLKPLLFL